MRRFAGSSLSVAVAALALAYCGADKPSTATNQGWLTKAPFTQIDPRTGVTVKAIQYRDSGSGVAKTVYASNVLWDTCRRQYAPDQTAYYARGNCTR